MLYHYMDLTIQKVNVIYIIIRCSIYTSNNSFTLEIIAHFYKMLSQVPPESIDKSGLVVHEIFSLIYNDAPSPREDRGLLNVITISWYKEIIITRISCPSLTYGND